MTINRKRNEYVQFNVGFYVKSLKKIDDVAKEIGISRAAFIRNCVQKELDQCRPGNQESEEESGRP